VKFTWRGAIQMLHRGHLSLRAKKGRKNNPLMHKRSEHIKPLCVT
jgi:hypothetical protein